MIEVIVGILFALLMIVTARTRKYESWVYSLSLISLPVIYMIFGFFAEGENVILNELLYGVPFIVLGIAGFRYGFKNSAYVIGTVWFFHAGYDLFHDQLFLNSGVFSWYPVFCAAVDFSVGFYLFYAASKWPRSSIKLAEGNA